MSYIALATTTLSSAASSVTFSSIPATFRDLRLVFSGTLSANGSIVFQLNSDTGNNYFLTGMTGSALGARSNNLTYFAGAVAGVQEGVTANIVSTGTLDIFDYSQTNKHKTTLARGSGGASLTDASSTRWANNSAVTTLRIFNNGGNLNSGTTLSLYGIAG